MEGTRHFYFVHRLASLAEVLDEDFVTPEGFAQLHAYNIALTEAQTRALLT